MRVGSSDERTLGYISNKQGVPLLFRLRTFPKGTVTNSKRQNLTSPPTPVRIAESIRSPNKNGIFVHVQDAKPFTGRIIVRNNFGQLIARLSCYGGQLHGICAYYWPVADKRKSTMTKAACTSSSAFKWSDPEPWISYKRLRMAYWALPKWPQEI